MLMAARSTGSPPWTRRPLPRPAGRSVATLRAIAGFMAPSGPKSGASRGSAGFGSDAEATEDEWEASETMEEEEEEDEEEEEEGVAFRDAEFHDEDEEGSEYEPSEDEEDESVDAAVDEDDRSVAGLFAKYLPRRPRSANPTRLRSLNLQKSGKVSSDSDDGAFGEQDAVLWEDEDDKRRWVSRYHAADRAFRSAFGCSIDSQAQPEVKRRLAKERTRRPVYTLLVVALLVMYASQLSGISLSAALSAASTAGHTITSLLTETTVSFTQPPEAEEIANDVRYSEEAAAHQLAASIEDEFVSESSTQPDTSTAEYVKAANDLCGQLLYRVVMSGREAKVTNNAESACDISVKLAPFGSLEAAVAHAQRGDLRSVLGQFQGADDDYTVAELALLSVSANFDDGETLPAIQEAVRGKSVANYWIQLYIARDVEMLVQQVTEMSGDPNPSELAAAWMRVFRRELSVLEGLTLLRLRTLRRLTESVPVAAQ